MRQTLKPTRRSVNRPSRTDAPDLGRAFACAGKLDAAGAEWLAHNA